MVFPPVFIVNLIFQYSMAYKSFKETTNLPFTFYYFWLGKTRMQITNVNLHSFYNSKSQKGGFI